MVWTAIDDVHLIVTVNKQSPLNFLPDVLNVSVATIYKLYVPVAMETPWVTMNCKVDELIENAEGTVPPAYIFRV